MPASAAFGMYPFDSVRWAWNDIWRATAMRCEWVDPALDHTDDVHASWADRTIAINQVCGWPFAAWYDGAMLPVGAFDVDLPGETEDGAGGAAGAGFYRSVLFSTAPLSLDELVARRAHAAVNSVDSLSGSISLHAAALPRGLARQATKWPGQLTETGAHVNSLRELRSGRADVACIDAWTLTLLRAEQPDATAGLYRIGVGPIIPTPAVTIRAEHGVESADALRAALVAALADPATSAARTALHIRGFVNHDMQVYRDTLKLS